MFILSPKSFFTSLLMVLILASCNTKYQSSGFTGGYSDRLTGKNTAVVEFNANGFTSSSTARSFAFRRAAELTLERGYDYFLVEKGSDMIDNSRTASTINCSSYGYSSNCTSNPGIRVRKPSTTLHIRMFKGSTPNKTGYYDASFLTK